MELIQELFFNSLKTVFKKALMATHMYFLLLTMARAKSLNMKDKSKNRALAQFFCYGCLTVM